MNTKIIKQSLLGIVLCLILALGTACIWPAPSAPSTMQTLDLTLTANKFYLSEDNYAETMTNEVIPYIDTYKTTGYFTSNDDAQLYYEQYQLENPSAHIVISHGFTETSQKYKEVIYYFLKSGYSVSILDHRGHGFSPRMTEDPSMVHIDSFDTYISDLKTFMDTIVLPVAKARPCFLYAHSMGGGIGSLFVERYPAYFDAAVLSSPMMEIDTGSYPAPIANLITKSMVLAKQGASYIFGQGTYDPEINFEESAATSESRYMYYITNRNNAPAQQLGGGSFNWFDSASTATSEIRKNAKKATLPLLVFQSENDTFVRPGGQYSFVAKAPNVTFIHVEDAKHELFSTSNDLMIPYFNTILNFFESHLA